MRVLAVIALSTLSTACSLACAVRSAPKTAEPPAPDTSKILKVVGRWTTASGCPVAPNRAFTAAHVIDPRPFEQYPGYVPVIFQQGARTGLMAVWKKPTMTLDEKGIPTLGYETQVSMARDLATLTTEVPMEFYPIATTVPALGDPLWISGWDWRDRKRAMADRVWKVTLVRIVAGKMGFDPAGAPATSGSCILNAAGEVVGVYVGGYWLDSKTGGWTSENEVIGTGWLVVEPKKED